MLAEMCTESSNWPGKGLREETRWPQVRRAVCTGLMERCGRITVCILGSGTKVQQFSRVINRSFWVIF